MTHNLMTKHVFYLKIRKHNFHHTIKLRTVFSCLAYLLATLLLLFVQFIFNIYFLLETVKIIIVHVKVQINIYLYQTTQLCFILLTVGIWLIIYHVEQPLYENMSQQLQLVGAYKRNSQVVITVVTPNTMSAIIRCLRQSTIDAKHIYKYIQSDALGWGRT